MIDLLKKLIDVKLDHVNTVDLGIITKVDLQKMRCNVKLKHKIQDKEIELFDVPIATLKFADADILIAPQEGDVAVILFSKFELEEQLKNKDVVEVNELYKFSLNNAIVVAGIYTKTDSIPSLDKGQILIKNKDLSILMDKSSNKITLKAEIVYIDGDLRFKKIMGVDAGDGVWHKH
ncbi:MAG: hypothetical protein QXV61_00210 [Archaeoglobaceae archaeon]